MVAFTRRSASAIGRHRLAQCGRLIRELDTAVLFPLHLLYDCDRRARGLRNSLERAEEQWHGQCLG